MGVASLACVSGCACKPSRIDATTPHLLSLFMPFVFEVSSGRLSWRGMRVGVQQVVWLPDSRTDVPLLPTACRAAPLHHGGPRYFPPLRPRRT